MSKNSWDKDLRARMEDYSEQPPEGLWEAIEGAVGAAGAGAGAAGGGESVSAGSKAGAAGEAGSRSRVRRFIPAFVALAGGIAAALIFMPVLHRPASVPSSSEFGVIASADHIDTAPASESDIVVSDQIAETTDFIVNNSDGVVSGSGDVLKKSASPADGESLAMEESSGIEPGSGDVLKKSASPAGGESLAMEESSGIEPGSGDVLKKSASPADGEGPTKWEGLFQNIPTAGDEAEKIAENSTVESSPAQEMVPTPVGETTITAGNKEGERRADIAERVRPARKIWLKPQALTLSMTGNVPSAASSSTGYGVAPSGPVRFGAPAATGLASTMTMLGRNKASTTDVVHNQTSRIGLLGNVRISEHLSVDLGIDATRLQSTYTTTTGSITVVEDRSMVYKGIPLSVKYDFFPDKRYGLYVSFGPRMEFTEKVVSMVNTYSGTTTVSSDSTEEELKGGSIWSVSLAAGAEYRIFEKTGVFVQPSLDWRFLIPDDAPESFYTTRRLSPSILFGLRFNLDIR